MNNKTWTNQDNIAFYEKVPYEQQYGFTTIGGLDVFSDLKQMQPYINKASSILEVGACYGRVIDYLLKYQFNGRITAIERSNKFFDLLYKKYLNSISLIHADIKTFLTDEKFDLILWLWNGCSDFSVEEQPALIKKLMGLLTPSGKLLIDSLSNNTQPINVSSSDSQHYDLDIGVAKLYGYIPSPDEMQIYAKTLYLKISCHHYETSTKRPRIFYVFENL